MTLDKPARLIRASVAVATVASLIAFAGCTKKADAAACQKMVDHDYGILDERNHISDSAAGKSLIDELKKKSFDACVAEMTMGDVACHMKAPTPTEMSACDKKDDK